MKKKILSLLLCVAMLVSLFSGLTVTAGAKMASCSETIHITDSVTQATPDPKHPKEEAAWCEPNDLSGKVSDQTTRVHMKAYTYDTERSVWTASTSNDKYGFVKSVDSTQVVLYALDGAADDYSTASEITFYIEAPNSTAAGPAGSMYHSYKLDQSLAAHSGVHYVAHFYTLVDQTTCTHTFGEWNPTRTTSNVCHRECETCEWVQLGKHWYTSGTGESTDPYIVSDTAGLEGLADAVNNDTDYSGKYIKLADDFTNSEAGLTTPIGDDVDSIFEGNFDGNGKEVKLNISTGTYAGLFGSIGEGATIKNVATSGSVTATSDSAYAGGVVGYIWSGGSPSVINCYSSCTVTASGNYSYAGGVVGVINSDCAVTNCYATGTVTATGTDSKAGGVVGVSNGTVTNCYCLKGNSVVGEGNFDCCYALPEAQMKGIADGEETVPDGAAATWQNINVVASQYYTAKLGAVSLTDALNEYVDDHEDEGYKLWGVMSANDYPVFSAKYVILAGGEAYFVHDSQNSANNVPAPMPTGLSYDSQKNRYVFDNLKMPVCDEVVLQISDENATIELKGKNQLGFAADTDTERDKLYYSSIGIYVQNGSLTFTGDGSLTIYDNCEGIYAKNITFDSNFTGTLNINDRGEGYNCCLSATDTVTIQNGTFNLNNTKTDGISAKDITISGGIVNVTGGQVGIFAASEDNNPDVSVTISGGTVNATAPFGIWAMSNGGTANITISGGSITANGAKTGTRAFGIAAYSDTSADKAVISITGGEVKAKGGNGAVCSLYGNTMQSATLTIADTLSVTDANEPYAAGVAKLTNKSTDTYVIIKAKSVAQIGETKYPTVQAAVTAATNGQTIKMTGDSTENVTVASDKTITLDLNGFVLQGENSSSPVITNEGTLTIIDNNADKEHKFSANESGLWTLNPAEGTKTVTGGVITGGNNTTDQGAGGGIENDGSLTMTGGNIVGNHAFRGGGFLNNGTATLNGVDIYGNTAPIGAGVHNAYYNTGLFTLENCVIKYNHATGSNNDEGTEGGAICNGSEYGNMTVTNCTITDNTSDSVAGGISNYGNLTIGGTTTVTGNTATKNGNNTVIYTDSTKLTVGTTAAGMKVGVSLLKYDESSDDYSLTSGEFTNNGSEADISCFYSDSPLYAVDYKDEYLMLTTDAKGIFGKTLTKQITAIAEMLFVAPLTLERELDTWSQTTLESDYTPFAAAIPPISNVMQMNTDELNQLIIDVDTEIAASLLAMDEDFNSGSSTEIFKVVYNSDVFFKAFAKYIEAQQTENKMTIVTTVMSLYPKVIDEYKKCIGDNTTADGYALLQARLKACKAAQEAGNDVYISPYTGLVKQVKTFCDEAELGLTEAQIDSILRRDFLSVTDDAANYKEGGNSFNVDKYIENLRTASTSFDTMNESEQKAYTVKCIASVLLSSQYRIMPTTFRQTVEGAEEPSDFEVFKCALNSDVIFKAFARQLEAAETKDMQTIFCTAFSLMPNITDEQRKCAGCESRCEIFSAGIAALRECLICTVAYDQQNGEEASSDTYAYGTTLTKPANPTKTGYTFGGWYTDKECTNAWNFANDKVTGTMTLYAKWINNSETKAVITGTVTENSNPVSGAVVELWFGTEKVAAANTDVSGKYSFDQVENGLYNIVIVKDGKTKTAMVNVDQATSFTADVILPAAAVNSKVELENMETLAATAKADVSDVVVGGVDAVAEAETPNGSDKITIVLTVAPKAESNTDDAQTAIKTTAGSKTVEFVDFTLTKQINSETPTNIGSTNNKILTITLPFDTTGIDTGSIAVYRYHDTAAALTKESAPMGTPADGHFYVDTANKLIYIYASQFSTYAIGYTAQSNNSSSSGSGVATYTVTAPSNVKNGSVTVSPKNASSSSKVTITVKPDKGYTLETLTVTDKNGKEVSLTKVSDTTYTFIMPNGNVTVTATFMEDNTMLNHFFDVTANDYFYDAVLWAAENGITSGTDATHFSPTGITTRAQMVTFLWRASGSPVVNYALPFTDVAEDSYYAGAVRWGLSTGVVKGTSATTFSPDMTVTRGQAVTFLYRLAGIDTLESKNNPFTDVVKGAFYYDAALWAAQNGITSGTTATTFSPNTGCKRGEVVTFLYRYFVK